MEQTKYWLVDGKLFNKKIEAQFYREQKINECFCKKDFSFSPRYGHSCCDRVSEISVKEIEKNKKYKLFIDSEIKELEIKKDISIKNFLEIEKNAI